MTLPEGTSAHLASMINEHLNLIHKVAFMYANQADDRRDLVQEIAYQICRSYKSFKGDSKPSTWIYRVAINTALSGLRKKQVLTESLSDHDTADEEEPDKEKTLALRKAIGQLNDADKSITLLFSRRPALPGNRRNYWYLRKCRRCKDSPNQRKTKKPDPWKMIN